ncbi:hypothetical protein B4135_0290 [Caldibacillus debilis]|uniref:Uncharacterized protein n=1 Tax=Caldibacillus debilis TaxID=301148 RepID=A0A150MER2_9BACI|nr:hypothetical protein B4135_0290 [Caldibacillus debilis]
MNARENFSGGRAPPSRERETGAPRIGPFRVDGDAPWERGFRIQRISRLRSRKKEG